MKHKTNIANPVRPKQEGKSVSARNSRFTGNLWKIRPLAFGVLASAVGGVALAWHSIEGGNSHRMEVSPTTIPFVAPDMAKVRSGARKLFLGATSDAMERCDAKPYDIHFDETKWRIKPDSVQGRLRCQWRSARGLEMDSGVVLPVVADFTILKEKGKWMYTLKDRLDPQVPDGKRQRIYSGPPLCTYPQVTLVRKLSVEEDTAERLRFLQDDRDLITPSFVENLCNYAVTISESEHFASALYLIESAQAAATMLGDNDALGRVLIHRALDFDVPSEANWPAVSIDEYTRHAVNLFRASGNVSGEAWAECMIGTSAALMWEFPKAEPHLLSSLRLAQKAHDDEQFIQTSINLANLNRRLNRVHLVTKYLDAAYESVRNRSAVNNSLYVCHIAETYSLLGDKGSEKRAENFYKQGIALAQQTGVRSYESQSHEMLAMYYASRANFDSALSQLDLSMNAARKCEDYQAQARILLIAGRIHKERGVVGKSGRMPIIHSMDFLMRGWLSSHRVHQISP